MRCGRASGTGAFQEFRDNRARPRVGCGARFRRTVPLGAPASSPARAKRARGRCESRRFHGEQATGGRAAARRRAVIDDADEDAGGPGEIGGAGFGHAHASRIALSGFRETPRADGPRGYPDRLPIKARSRPLRERTMVRPSRRRWRRRSRPRQSAPRPKSRRGLAALPEGTIPSSSADDRCRRYGGRGRLRPRGAPGLPDGKAHAFVPA